MSNELNVLHKLGYELEEEKFEKIREKHRYISDKLVLDAMHGVKEVTTDLNNVSKSKEKGFARFVDGFLGNSKKRQNLMNENFTKGFEAVSEYLLDHDRHLTRIDKRIGVIADELVHTQEEILKFSKQVNDRLGKLEQFQKNATQKFQEIEKRFQEHENRFIMREAKEFVYEEVLNIKKFNLPLVIKVFTVLDNIVSGEAGLYYMQEKSKTKRKRFLEYIKNELNDKLKLNHNELEKFIDAKELNLEIQKLDTYEQEAIAFISSQHRIFSSKIPLYDAVDLVRVVSTTLPSEIDTELSNNSHIREFITLESFIDDALDELFNTNETKKELSNNLYIGEFITVELFNDDTSTELCNSKKDLNTMNNTKLGVVLSGGGAKGAYEVGFLKALTEFNVQPEVIAGTSIGALNGTIYASTKNTKMSATLLEELWDDLASSNVLKVDKTKAMKNLVEVFSYFAPMPVGRLTKIAMALTKAGKSEEGLLTQLPIVNRLEQYAPTHKLELGLPFYVGMTKARGNIRDVINFSGFGNEETEFKKIQDLSSEDMHKAIMASAALPILFDGIEVEGKVYRDGCLSSTDNEWGNTPVKPLIEKEGCTHIIVCHLNEGSFFNRHDPLFDDVAIIEVRPKSNTFSSALDPLQFKVEKIEEWKEQGYQDAKRVLSESFRALSTNYARQQAEYEADEAIDRLKSREFKL